jgi:hypothetical protein
MAKPIEGGSAFPHPQLEIFDEARHDYDSKDACQGMSLRQWYIGQALAGLCANPDYPDETEEAIAFSAIEQADALMKLLSEESKGPKP